MKYIANPVEVDAEVITFVGDEFEGKRILSIGDGMNNFEATPGMLARMTPEVGDYVVTQSDGYVYLNPKAVFERKYHPAENTVDSKGNFHGSAEAEEVLNSVKSLRRN